MDKAAAEKLFDRLGDAISRSDLASVSGCFAVPAMILSDEGTILLEDRQQIEKIFAQAMQWYHSQGLRATRPDIERSEELSEAMVSVDVRWPAFDASGTEKSSERSRYLVRRGSDGQPYIQVALSRTK